MHWRQVKHRWCQFFSPEYDHHIDHDHNHIDDNFDHIDDDHDNVDDDHDHILQFSRTTVYVGLKSSNGFLTVKNKVFHMDGQLAGLQRMVRTVSLKLL